MPSEARILVVEDEGIVAMDIQESLQRLGYQGTEVACSGEAALEMAEHMNPDLVLMDIRLGRGMDGVETALALGETRDVPVVYLTAYTDERTLESAKMTQPFGYLVKPFSPKELQTTIEIALNKHAMESSLRKRELWLGDTLRSIGEAVVATDPEGRILFMNPLAQDLTGWSEAEALDRDLEDVVPLVDALGRARETVGMELDFLDPASQAGALKLRQRNGGLLPVEGLSAVIGRGPRGARGTVLVLREAAWRRDREADGARAEAAQRRVQMEAMGKLARGIAHDFNNQLSVIMGMSEMLAADLHGEPYRQDLVEEIRKACRQSVGLTKQLQAFARRESFELQSVDLNYAVLEAERILVKVLGSEITLRTLLEPNLPPVSADLGCLEQAILNLALNARDAMPQGGSLVLSTSIEYLENPALSFQFPLRPGPHILLRVEDSGHGIPADVRPHIFEPFFTTKGKVRCTGLGLAMVEGMMRHVGGNILVRSEPGQGASFFLCFPVSASI